MKYLLLLYLIIGFIIASMDLHRDRKHLKEEATLDVIGGFVIVWILWPIGLLVSWIRQVIHERKCLDEEKDD